MSSPRRTPKRPLPELGDIPTHGRQIVHALMLRNRRDLQRNGSALGNDQWTSGFLEGVYAAGGLRTRAEVNRVVRAIQRDVLDTLIA
jgi:hypothetical protein